MIRLAPLVLWLSIFLTSVGCSGGAAKLDIGRLLTSGRDGWQHPERVIEALDLEPGDRVAEIGAGKGYWLPWLSQAVGPSGRVYAVEVEQQLVRALEARVAREGLDNVEVVLAEYHDPRLPEAAIDLALTCLTFHHIEHRVDYFAALRTRLVPDGRVAHLDDRPDAPAPISWFQSEGHWTEPTAIVQEMAEAGYARVAEFDFLPAQSFQIFAPHAEAAPARTAGPHAEAAAARTAGPHAEATAARPVAEYAEAAAVRAEASTGERLHARREQ